MHTQRVSSVVRRLFSGALACVYTSSLLAISGVPGGAAPAMKQQPLYTFTLPDGKSAVVFKNGVAQVFTKDHMQVQTRLFASIPKYSATAPNAGLPDQGHLYAALAAGPKKPFVDGRVIVVFQQGVSPAQDVQQLDKTTMVQMRTSLSRHQLSTATPPQYTNDATTNRALAALGTDRTERMFRQFSRSSLSALRMGMSTTNSLDFSNAYRLHLTGSSVRSAVQALSKLPSVAYVSPDFTVDTMNAPGITVPQSMVQAVRPTLSFTRSAQASSTNLPANYATASSAQSMLNAPSDDAMAAFDEIENAYHQLPGQGEIITNVSLGDLDDSSATASFSNPCRGYVRYYGPTTQMIGGQRYLNLPSMPLIPTYTADSNGNLNGAGQVCGVDPYNAEIGLDFSMMAPLPHNQQRAGEQGSGFADLLGIAPGASYRLVVPGTSAPTSTDIDAAFLGAAMQQPRPNVITASLGFGYDGQGFPSRYLEDDPLTESLIAAIVHTYNIVVCISAGDGTRTYTNVAIAPSGGSVATNTAGPNTPLTNLNDVALSTAPSVDLDSGAIDVGGTTLDDIFAVQPQNPQFAALRNQHAYPETRYTGFTAFSSGFGTRVNVSAPGDNVLSLQHHQGGSFDSVDVSIEGGTSASAPEVAAAAAVLLQVGQLSGQPFQKATQVRQFLMTHGNAVPNLPQSDEPINVGPQIDLTKAVEALMGRRVTPAVPRVAIEQRRNYANLDAVFLSATDPSNIDLSGANETSWITIAPDWEGLSGGSYTYSLYVAGKPAQKLATTSSARLLPAQILAAAGMPLASSSSRTVNLTYAALNGNHVLTQTTFALSFGPAAAQTTNVLAPIVPPLVTGTTIPVAYDLTNASYSGTPSIVVSEPGRFDPVTGNVFHPSYTAPLPGGVLKGTINVPVSALQGGGVYGIGIAFGPLTYKVGYPTPPMTDFAFTRVAPTASSLRPVAPLLSYNGSTPAHFLEVPYNGSFQLSYDVRNVTGATGAIVEISAAGPTEFGTYNPFNNPNGTIPDHNGVDTGSVYTASVSGTSGTVTINPVAANLVPTLEEVVRVIPMSGSVAAGEAGDVSFITMDGVLAADGGYIDLGYGINSKGTDGFITSDQRLATGETIGSVETFDQVKNSIVQNVQSANGTVYRTYGSGVFGNDLGFFVTDLLAPPWTETGNFLNPVAGGTLGGTWTSPSSSFYLQEVAANQASDVAAFLAQDESAPFGDQMRLFTSNLTANASSTTADLSLPLQGKMSFPTFAHIVENTSTNQAAIAVSDFGNWCGSPILETVDLGTFAVNSFQGIGSGLVYGLDVDSSTNKAAVTTMCDFGLSIYDLGSKTGTEVALPGDTNMFGVFTGGEVTADPVSHEFLVVQQVSGDAETNNNSLGSILVYDENGRLLKTLERFALAGQFMYLSLDNLQINPSRHMGYFLGANGQELEPFSY